MLATNHFISLNPSTFDAQGQVVLGDKAIISQLKDAINAYSGQEKDFLTFLLGPNGQTLKKILIGMPADHEQVIRDFHQQFPSLAFKQRNSNNRLVWTPLGNTVNEIFDYDTYRASLACIDHLKALGMDESKPCPYCNLATIGVVDRIDPQGKPLALLDLDHFYPHGKYPFLGASLYNLVPTCKLCNQTYKKSKIFSLNTHIHPYVANLDDHFVFGLTEPYVYGAVNRHIDFSYKPKSTFPDTSLQDFEIMQRYNTHWANVVAKLDLLHHRPIRTMHQVFGGDYELGRQMTLKGMGIPFDKDEIKNHVLGKLYRDLAIASECYY